MQNNLLRVIPWEQIGHHVGDVKHLGVRETISLIIIRRPAVIRKAEPEANFSASTLLVGFLWPPYL